MWLTSLIIFLIIVGFAGWLAGLLVYGRGFGLIRNLGIGLLGAILSYVLLGLFGVQVASFLAVLLVSTAGATVILATIKTSTRRSTKLKV